MYALSIAYSRRDDKISCYTPNFETDPPPPGSGQRSSRRSLKLLRSGMVLVLNVLLLFVGSVFAELIASFLCLSETTTVTPVTGPQTSGQCPSRFVTEESALHAPRTLFYFAPQIQHQQQWRRRRRQTTTSSVLLPGSALGRSARQPAQERSPVEEPGVHSAILRLSWAASCAGGLVGNACLQSSASPPLPPNSSLVLFSLCSILVVILPLRPFHRTTLCAKRRWWTTPGMPWSCRTREGRRSPLSKSPACKHKRGERRLRDMIAQRSCVTLLHYLDCGA